MSSLCCRLRPWADRDTSFVSVVAANNCAYAESPRSRSSWHLLSVSGAFWKPTSAFSASARCAESCDSYNCLHSNSSWRTSCIWSILRVATQNGRILSSLSNLQDAISLSSLFDSADRYHRHDLKALVGIYSRKPHRTISHEYIVCRETEAEHKSYTKQTEDKSKVFSWSKTSTHGVESQCLYQVLFVKVWDSCKW